MSEATKRKRVRARVRHNELRYCVPCGLKAAPVGACPSCGLPLTARTSKWKSAELARIVAQSGHPIHQARERAAVRHAAQRQQEEMPVGDMHETWLADQPGHPMGIGMPMGEPLRMDGESHSNAWRRILRLDPCAYCGASRSGTVDHIEPRSRRKVGTERWVNLVGACERCNTAKAAKPLIWFLLTRQYPPRVAS